MKLSTYAKKIGLSYLTVYKMWTRGEIKGSQLPSGTIIVEDENTENKGVIIYTRVSCSQNRKNLDTQAERLVQYCTAKGYTINKIVKEVGSGVNDNRKQLNKLIEDKSFSILIVEHKDRLTRVGFNYLKQLFKLTGREIEVVNLAEEETEDLMHDFISIITSFCARLYSIRRRTRKTQQIIEIINETNS